jgi:hypothetical protein
LILASDKRVQRIVARTILITAASLILGGLIPDEPKPLPAYTTVAGTTLLIASAALIYSYGRFSYLLIIDYSSPRSFVGHVVDPVTGLLNQKKVNTGLIVYRVPLLAQTLRYALEREDAETLYASLDGLRSFQRAYVAASTKTPSLRNHKIGPNNTREAWLADELYRTYMGVCEQALRLQSPQHEIDQIVDYFADATRTFITAHQEAESKQMMDGLAQLTASPYQVSPNVTNYLTRPATSLASAEQSAEAEGQVELASFALANWAVAMAYPQVHFGYTFHPLFAEGVGTFGEHPPFNRAIEHARDPSWNIRWANQLQFRLDAVVKMLELARDLHEGTDGTHFKARRRAVYTDWLDTTKNIAVGLVMNAEMSMRRLEGVNYYIAIFGSPAVQAATNSYFASYQGMLNSLSSAIAPNQSDELLQAVSAAFEQEPIVTARAAVVAVMEHDLGENLE